MESTSTKRMDGVNFGSKALFPLVYKSVMRPPFWTTPSIYIDQSSFNQAKKSDLEAIIKRFGAKQVSRADATHIVVPTSPQAAHDRIYTRILETRPDSSKSLVHFWYHPDSQDTWVQENQIADLDPTQTPQSAPQGPFTVTERYLRDLEQYGEWMNEQDYDPSEEAQNSRKSSFVAATASKKRPHSDAQRNGTSTSSLNPKRAKLSEDGPDGTKMVGIKSEAGNYNASRQEVGTSGAYGVLLQPGMKTIGAQGATNVWTGASPHVPISSHREGAQPSLALPHHLSWFDMASIHDIEKTALPEFFADRAARSTNKTAEIYREYRDFMIQAYQQNPAHYLNYTSCRRSLAGDACAIMRVFDFLEATGLINYAVNPDVQGIYPLPPPLPNPSDTIRQLLQIDNLPPSTSQGTPSLTADSIFLREAAAFKPVLSADAPVVSSQQAASSKCHVCNAPTPYLSFVHKKPYTVLCPDCYATPGATTLPLTSFEKVDLRSQKMGVESQRPWSDDEILLLLEGIEEYGEDWDKVALHVRSRDKEACILHFIRLPIDDSYHQNLSTSDKSQKELHLSDNGTPINPIPHLVSFLTQTVSPQCAAAASQAALKVYMAEHHGGPSFGAEDHGMNGVSANTATTSSAMEVDSSTQSEIGANANEEAKDSDSAQAAEVTAVASAALAAATVKAVLLAEKEEREMRKLVHQVVDAQMKKFELKMQYLEEMERFLETENARLESSRLQLFEERFRFEEERQRAMDIIKKAEDISKRGQDAMFHSNQGMQGQM